MASPRHNSPSSPQTPDSTSRSPGRKRNPLTSSERLATITEGGAAANTPPIPRRSSQRLSALLSGSGSHGARHPRPGPGSQSSIDTSRAAPPSYGWVPPPLDENDVGNPPVEGEKLAELRRNTSSQDPKRGALRGRGGWGRLALIGAGILLVIIALAVGLGVGLGEKHHNHSSSSTPSNPQSTLPPQKFPLGQYSFVTALTNVQTNCTSNAAVWQCYPFNVYNPGVSSTINASTATFNWIISNTSSNYITNNSSETPASPGVPALLSVSSISDPFGITFNSTPLSYIATADNSTSSRYVFDFSMPKMVIPSTSITSDGTSAVCFFNQTSFQGTIYLTAAHNFPPSGTSIGGYEQWPYAVEIMEVASGGSNVPDCYEYVNGVVGSPITTDLTSESSNSQCLCEYRNYV